nr:SURP and G-patch domain-containing protein 1-like isoform X2 [Penaeus vannamei]
MSNKYPVQDRMREMSKQEEILLKRKREIERKMKEQKQAEAKASRTPPLPKVPAPATTSASVTSLSVPRSSSVPNKFSNDGSFFEQFKKMSGQQTVGIKEEGDSSVKFKSSLPLSTKSKALNQVPPPKQFHPAIFSPEKKSTLSPSPEPVKVKTEFDIEENTSSIPESVKNEADHPDWFKDALKRAQEKAKQLSQASRLVTRQLY